MTKWMSYSAKTNAVFMVLVMIILTALDTIGQSGRSIPKQTQTVPAPTPAPTPIANKRTDPDLILWVVADIQPDAHHAFPKPENMQIWAIERLRKSPLLVVHDGGFATRSDAAKKAKEGAEAYIVLLQLETDNFGRPDIASRAAAGQVWIRLTVLSPGTGKETASAKIALNEELRNNKMPPSIISTCHRGIYGNDYLLLEASIKAADYVMSSLSIQIPPDCPK